ncbi:energy transducer TonB [Barnesiella viscericola]|uniref:Energy transducer TonB n=1 Tax=Barnesiella viscericola TaxID=397865 RepID=A0A921MS73_9BACT|nr:energy transducer TonB [Barnesiella viscericola]HJG89610.1 energy transducer TonB [Barnesiella viscericola]
MKKEVLFTATAIIGLLLTGCNATPSTEQGTTPDSATETTTAPTDSVFEVAEVMPEFPGGTQALFKFISGNLKYPQNAIDGQIEGRVVLQFVVDKEGKVGSIQVVRSVDKMLDQAAIDVVRALPDWKPGMQKGQPVNVRYTLPVSFKLS